MRKYVKFELANRHDAIAIAIMSRDLVETGLGWSWTPARVMKSIRHPATNVLVARLAGQVIGFAIMVYTEQDAHLNLLAIKPEYQRQGIGCHLVRWLEKCALMAGISVVYLEVRANNNDGLSFYHQLGYQHVKPLKAYYRGFEAAILMGRDLWYTLPTQSQSDL